MRVQHELCETLLLSSTYNQKQAHAEYEIVSITSFQVAKVIIFTPKKDEGQRSL